MLTTKWKREARTKQEEGGMFAAAGQRVAEKSYGLGEEGGDWGGQPGALVCQTGRFSLQRLQIMIAADLIGHRRSKHEIRASQLI